LNADFYDFYDVMLENYKYAEVTEIIIQGFYNVYNKLGYGFLESVYEKALLVELSKLGLSCKCQCPIEVLQERKSRILFCRYDSK